MNRFVEEEVHANFNHKGPILNKSKKQRKRIYDANNARNRDAYLKAQMAGKLEFTGSSIYKGPKPSAKPNRGLDFNYDKAEVHENSIRWDDKWGDNEDN